jgi:exodeoxyribonuclease-3
VRRPANPRASPANEDCLLERQFLKVRLPHLLDWLAAAKPDALCLQELKLEDQNFPRAEIEAAGYQVAFSGQKTYNGVALLAREPIHDIVCGNPHFPDEQKRLISGSIGDVRVICAYMPNGQAVGSEKYDYKLRWLDGLAVWLDEEMQKYPKLALCGDYNIAPDDRDVHDPRPGPAAFFAPNPSAPPSSASSDWA